MSLFYVESKNQKNLEIPEKFFKNGVLFTAIRIF